MGDGSFVLLNGRIVRPVEMESLPRVVIHISVSFRAGERLVWVETLEMEVPVVGRVIVFEKVDSACEALRSRIVLIILGIHKLTIDPIGSTVLALKLRYLGIIYEGPPDVPLLTSHELPTVEARVITLTSAVEVVIMVRDHVGIGLLLTP
jgi:hypothetical protein